MKRTRAELEKEFEELSKQLQFHNSKIDKENDRRIYRRLRILFNRLYPELK